VDCISADDNLLDVPIVYRSHTESDLLQEIAELRAEIKRLQNVKPLDTSALFGGILAAGGEPNDF
jgi:hypothetical protein